MFRVSKEEKRSRAIITIDGQISGDHIGVVETVCNQAMANGKQVHLVLRDVSTVDRAGRALLQRLATEGVGIFASGVYTSFLVQSLRPAEASPGAEGSVATRSKL